MNDTKRTRVYRCWHCDEVILPNTRHVRGEPVFNPITLRTESKCTVVDISANKPVQPKDDNDEE